MCTHRAWGVAAGVLASLGCTSEILWQAKRAREAKSSRMHAVETKRREETGQKERGQKERCRETEGEIHNHIHEGREEDWEGRERWEEERNTKRLEI